ncbi:MAG: site-specific DNA-methyltransferase [Bacteroidetes bacterium]|nr:site-specific DNA-methyltransferase [Bacteroidota bacterium]
MINFPLPRLDKDQKLSAALLKYCRLDFGEIWKDPKKKHSVACMEATDKSSLKNFVKRNRFQLAVHDPPYNMVAFHLMTSEEFAAWSKKWIDITYNLLTTNSALYVWLGADQKNNFQPFADFILMMGQTKFQSKSFITMRNQRGYGTSKNWMAIRQELLYYAKGNPEFNSEFVYTDIPKIVQGYYKNIQGKRLENLERSKNPNIRAGNVWIDVQQVFHLMEENVNGCFAQKPLKAIERIINVSTKPGAKVIDFFSHTGTTLLASEKLNRKCYTVDINPIYCEITIRRLERFRSTGKTGWQNSNPFADEIKKDSFLRDYLFEKYEIEVPKIL